MRWIYNSHTTQWQTSFGGWRAIVELLSAQGIWRAAIMRRYPPYHAPDQKDFGWPRAAMTWCEEEIMCQRWHS